MRYFKATNGKVTVFRASATRVYVSAWIWNERPGASVRFGFSEKARRGWLKAEEITREAFLSLNDSKAERLSAIGRDPTRAAPADSWISANG